MSSPNDLHFPLQIGVKWRDAATKFSSFCSPGSPNRTGFGMGRLKPRPTFSPHSSRYCVKGRADFVAVVSRYTRLRRAGRQFVGLCPFHREQHPSFYVRPEKKIFLCFGYGSGGDLFDFVICVERCDFRRAVEIVAAFPGVGDSSGDEKSLLVENIGVSRHWMAHENDDMSSRYGSSSRRRSLVPQGSRCL